MKRSLELSTRKKKQEVRWFHQLCALNYRDKRHYDESISIVEDMFAIRQVHKNGNEPQAENIWRAQIVFIVSDLILCTR